MSFLQFQVLLAEGDAAPSPLSWQNDLALWTLIVFLILLFVLTKFAWRPIIDGLNAREKSIEDSIASAKTAEEQAQENLKRYEEKLAGANDEAAAIIAEARASANVAKEKIQAEAGEEAGRLRERAYADIEAAKAAAVSDLAQSSVDTAVDLAGNIVGRSLKDEDHSRLIKDSLERFGA